MVNHNIVRLDVVVHGAFAVTAIERLVWGQ